MFPQVPAAPAGSKGERRYAWAWIGSADPRRHPLIRRSLVPNEKRVREVAFYLCYVPEGRPVTLRTLIAIAGRRWPVEEDFQVGKTAFGLDHSQIRTYLALLRPRGRSGRSTSGEGLRGQAFTGA